MPEKQLVKSIFTKDFGIVSEDEQIVEGYITDDLIDVDGHVIDADGFRSALIDYFQYGNIRDQHGLPVGKVVDAPEWNKFVVKILDDSVWKKVKAGLYRGFSVGIRVLDYEIEEVGKYGQEAFRGVPQVLVDAIKAGGWIFRITKMVLAEVSIVDRPANPRALITATKNIKNEIEDKYVPVLRTIIEAQKQYEGDLEMAKKTQTVAASVVEDSLEKTVESTEAIAQDVAENVESDTVDNATQENIFETKFASLEGTVNELKAAHESLAKQLGEISQVLSVVSKTLEAQAESMTTEDAVDEQDASIEFIDAKDNLTVEAKMFDVDSIVDKIAERIEKSIMSAVEKAVKPVEQTERSGAVNLGDGSVEKTVEAESTSAKTQVTRKKASYGDAAKLLAGVLNRQQTSVN